MSTVNKSVMNFGVLGLLLVVAGCSAQTLQPAAPSPAVVSIVPSSTPLPPAAPLPSAVPPYFNAYRSAYPQPYVGGPNVAPQYFGAPNVAPQYIGAPNVPQRFGPYTGQFVPILQQSFDISPEGSYTFSYQSADGTQRQESGALKYPSAPGLPPAMSVQGSYSAITPEGIPIEVAYLADENGYQPTGPGVHPAIQRAVAQQVALAKQEQQQQPQYIK